MYVAITRARKRLYLSYAGSRMLHGQPRYGSSRASWRRFPRAVQVDRPSRQTGLGLAAEVGLGQARLGGGGAGRGVVLRRGRRRGPTRTSTRRRRGRTSRWHAPTSTLRHRRERAPRQVRRGGGDHFEGRGLDARVQVRFRTEGTKWLALQYAKLTPAEPRLLRNARPGGRWPTPIRGLPSGGGVMRNHASRNTAATLLAARRSLRRCRLARNRGRTPEKPWRARSSTSWCRRRRDRVDAQGGRPHGAGALPQHRRQAVKFLLAGSGRYDDNYLSRAA